MTRNEKFKAAIEMTNSFILNGDIRFQNTKEGSFMASKLEDLITTLYDVIDKADQRIDPGA